MSHVTAASLGEGALQFLQWDMVIGFATTLIPSMISYHHSQSIGGNYENMVGIIFKTTVAVVVVGRGATLMGLTYLEDETVVGGDGKNEDKKQ